MARPKDCQSCHGPLMELGKLGTRQWYRCRSCGLEFSAKVVTSHPMTTAERCAKIQEAKQWLSCKCTICNVMRNAVGKAQVEQYIKMIKEAE